MANSDVYLDKGLRGWIANTARKEHWRMPDWYSLEDLEQDGYLCYAKCLRYIGTDHGRHKNIFSSDNPTPMERRWFMTLVQRAYYNHIMTLAAKAAKAPKETAMSQTVEEGSNTWESLMPPVLPDAQLLHALSQLPAELSDVLVKLFQDGVDSGVYLRKRITGSKSRRTIRETTEEYWTRVLGQPDVPQKLADYIRT